MELKTYIDKRRGRASALGKVLGVSPTLISQWANKKRPVPAERCPEIEKETEGKVTCEELCPEVDWAYVRSTGLAK